MTESTRDVVTVQPVVLDPNFFVPPGVVDVRYVNETDTDSLYIDDPNNNEADPDATATDDLIIDTTTTGLEPPANITIVSQTVKVAADGRFVVDVVIDVEDAPGVTTYESRLTKV
jgi:shikimate 5-dehydrogenase